jgi:hypothetical protein
MNRTEEIIEQSHNLTKLGLSLGDIRDVLKYARVLNAINTRQCNGYQNDTMLGWDEKAAQRDEKRETKIKTLLIEILTGQENNKTPVFAHSIHFQGDPRGAPIIINEETQTEFRVWG